MGYYRKAFGSEMETYRRGITCEKQGAAGRKESG